jgi:dTDP-4-amino-4,6-dideoxygalactose transaminase
VFAGEGGILVTNNERAHHRATLLGHYRDRPKQEIRDPGHWNYWVTGFGLKLRMSPFNAIVAKHSLSNYERIKSGRHKCLTYFNERLMETRSIQPMYIAPYADMGAWYGFKPLYRSEALGGLSRDRFIEALQAEGVEIANPSAPTLSTQPLYRDAPDLMFPRRTGKLSNNPSTTPIAAQVENTSLSLPTFYDWTRDRFIIDSYMDAFLKVERHYGDLLES